MSQIKETKATMKMRLPIGIENFTKIRKNKFYYVDKTHLIEKLTIDSQTNKKVPGYYFLSRPRRFGKSLLLDTIQCLFEGKKELFEGLHIFDKWDWSEQHPVIRITFGGGECKTLADVEAIILQNLAGIRKKYDLPADLHPDLHHGKNSLATKQTKNPMSFFEKLSFLLSMILPINTHFRTKNITSTNISMNLTTLISDLKEVTGQEVVVLIDEYDLPILEVLDDPTKARQHCSFLRGVYGTLKANQKDIHFIFITGISMFSKVDLFSKINHLDNITMSSEFSSICGYTSHDLKTVFAPEIKFHDFEKIQKWYDGYSWDIDSKSERLFCPHSVLMLFRYKNFKNWWYKACTPKYMYEIMKKNDINSLTITNRRVNSDLLESFDVANPDVNILMFQNGYLTIREITDSYGNKRHRFEYPNREVAQCLTREYHEHLMGAPLPVEFADHGPSALDVLSSLDAHRLRERLHQILAGLHYNLYSDLRYYEYESCYAGHLYTLFVSHSCYISLEEGSSHGRSDLVIGYKNQIFVLEIKCINHAGCDPERAAQKALMQIRDKKYADKHQRDGASAYGVAMIFGKKERNVLHVVIEDLD